MAATTIPFRWHPGLALKHLFFEVFKTRELLLYRVCHFIKQTHHWHVPTVFYNLSHPAIQLILPKTEFINWVFAGNIIANVIY